MRYVTEYSDHVYTAKSSALRAARNAVGAQLSGGDSGAEKPL